MKKKNQGVLEEGWAGKVQDESGMPVYARKNDGDISKQLRSQLGEAPTSHS